jgi:hypothetical protein
MKSINNLVLFLSVIMATSCNSQPVTSSTLSTEPSITESMKTPSRTVELTPTSIAISIPTSARTPLPTLNSEERDVFLTELMQTNGNCSEPCFWGIIPGMSNFDDAVVFLKSLGRKGLEGATDSTRYFNVTYPYKEDLIGLGFLEQGGKVEDIRVGLDGLDSGIISSSDWSAFRPDSIIKTHGTPSSVKIGLGEGPNGYVIYQLLLSYDTEKLNILYDPIDDAILPTPFLHTCPLADRGIRKMKIWLGGTPTPQDLVGMKGIEEVTSLTVDEFSKLILDKGEKACFKIDLKGVGNQ